jgi:cysteine synthase
MFANDVTMDGKMFDADAVRMTFSVRAKSRLCNGISSGERFASARRSF